MNLVILLAFILKNTDFVESAGTVPSFPESFKFNDSLYYTNFRARFWNNSVIYFDVDPHLLPEMRKAVYEAVEYINNMEELCIVWLERYSFFNDYIPSWVSFTYYEGDQQGGECSANVGRTGRQQHLHIGVNCTIQALGYKDRLALVILHEMGHAMGLFHEHQRPDRDCFIYAPIEYITKQNMRKLPGYFFPKGFPYDSKSFMHYTNWNIPKAYVHADKTLVMGRPGLSFSRMDIEKLNHLYCGGPTWCATRRSGMCVDMYSWMDKDPNCLRHGQAYAHEWIKKKANTTDDTAVLE